ncbi:MAG TPA: 2OG-Fe(II) oxygenase [Pedomonas sp.]|uniref:2OG-Fe(II) oxygenase n=1 Tax=Pedomonas sp. TaxID=2976421 RepID=UPI002F411EC5
MSGQASAPVSSPAPDARVSAAMQAFRRGAPHEGVPLMQAAAKDGHPLAQLAVAEWLATGSRLPRDPAKALELARHAAQSGLPPAMQLYACLLRWENPEADAEGVQDAIAQDANDWTRRAAEQGEPAAQAEVRLWPHLAAPLPEAEILSGAPLNDAPAVKVFPGFLPPALCQHVLRMARPQVRPAAVFDPASGETRPHPVRRAHNMNFGPTLYDSIIAWVNQRIAAASGTTAAQGEPLAVLAYGPGGEYRPHSDCLPPSAARPEDRLAESGQRIRTLLIALNTGYTGGETAFPALSLTWRGQPGDALLFTNTTEDGTPAPEARHAGQPVLQGEKWLASRWIRERAFSA